MNYGVMAVCGLALLAACGPKPPSNSPPQFSSAPPANASAPPATPVSVTFNVTDPNDDAVTVTATGLPPGLAVHERADVTTVAGTGVAGFADGPAGAAQFNYPYGVAVDAAGNIFVGDSANNRIRKIDPTGEVTTVAGRPSAGFWDGPHYAAQFDDPEGLTVDAAGNIYVADSKNHRIRKIDPTGVVSTFAGTGVKGSKGGPILQAQFERPGEVVFDKSGNLFVAASSNMRIWKIDTAGEMTAFAGTGGGPGAVGYKTGSPLPKPKVGAATSIGLDMPEGVAIGPNGDVYLTETPTVRRVDAAGMLTTVAGEIEIGFTNGPGEFARFKYIHGVDVDSKGNLFVADTWNDVIRKIDPTGLVTTYAGAGVAGFADGPAATARFSKPRLIAIDSGGSIFVADERNHRIRRITPNGYEIAGTYSGDPCGGQFVSTIRATDIKGAFTETKIVFDVPKSESCETEETVTQTGGAPGPGPAITYDVSARKAIQTFQYPKGLATIFAINVRNEGPGLIDANSGVVVTDTLPANFATPISVNAGLAQFWTCTPNGLKITCEYVGQAAPAGTDLPAIVFEAFGKTAGKYQNCAAVSMTLADTNPDNDTGCANGEVVPPFDLSLKKFAKPPTVAVGQDVEFYLTPENFGTMGVDAASDVVITDSLPPGFGAPVTIKTSKEWVCTAAGTSVSCEYDGPLVPKGGGFPPIWITARAKTAGQFENCARIASDAADTVPENDLGCAKGEITGVTSPPTGLLEIKKDVVDLTGGTPLALYKFPIYLSCSNNPGIWVPVPLAANSSKLSPPSPAGITCSAAENWGAAGPQVPSVKCPGGKASWTPSYFPDSGQGAATVQIPAGGVATIVITNTLKCDEAVPPPSGAQLVVEKVVEESATGLKWKAPFPTGPNTAFAIEVTCPNLNGGKPMSLKVEHQKSETISVPVGETCSVVEPAQAQPSGLAAACMWEPVKTSYLNVDAGTTSSTGASVTLAKAKAYTVRVVNKAHCLGLGLF